MDLYSEIQLPSPIGIIERDTPLLFMGSCFSENIGYDLQLKKCNITINPFGITYNPVSIFSQLKRLAEKRFYTAVELRKHRDLWFSFDHHGHFSHVDRDTCLAGINEKLEQAVELQNPVIVLTLGTGWLWRLKEENSVVNNCHKLPGNKFMRELPALQELQAAWKEVRSLYPRNRFIVSISPVRYGDAVSNNRGKALLHLFCHWLEAEGEIDYFPAYEMLHDQLRDYRFYAEDLKHPSQQAIEIIRKAFYTWALSDSANTFYAEVEKLQRNLSHRPLHPETGEARKFYQNMENILSEMMEKYPQINWNKEVTILKNSKG
jgi:hypothetical protein